MTNPSMSPRREPTSADELMHQLEQNPEFVLGRRQRMAERESNRQRHAEAAAGLLRDLDAAGFPVESLAQLRDRQVGHRGAVPVLVRWLPTVTYLPLKRDIIATLGSSWARPEAARPLIEEFGRVHPAEDTLDTSVRWSIGDALQRIADESVLDELLLIATDARHGRHRGLVVAALGNMAKARARVLPVLLALLDDDEVAGYAVMALGNLNADEARRSIERFLDHPQPWVRKEAKKALAKLPG